MLTAEERDKIIERIVKDVETWDRTSLIQEAKARVKESMVYMDDDSLLGYYEAQFPVEE